MTKSRVYTFQLIYEYLFLNEYQECTMNSMIESDPDLNKYDVAYIKNVYKGVVDSFDVLVETVEKYALNFSFDRIFKADLALLLLGIYEMKFMPKIPLKVTINEILEISKVYSTKKSFNYINGILAKVYKEVEDANN